MFSVGDSYKPVYIDDLEPEEFDTALLWSGSGTQKIVGTVKQPVCYSDLATDLGLNPGTFLFVFKLLV